MGKQGHYVVYGKMVDSRTFLLYNRCSMCEWTSFQICYPP